MSGNSNKKIAFNYFGGKFTWLDNLYQNFPAQFSHLVDLFAVCFSYGYTRRRMTFECKGITIGRGRPEWGAPEHTTFIIKLGKRL